jgi:hypothetical protein
VNGIRRVINSVFIYFAVNSSCTRNQVFSSNQPCEHRVRVQHSRICVCLCVTRCFVHASLCACVYDWGSMVFYHKNSRNFFMHNDGLKWQEGVQAC